jgi:hypothetical protein
MRRMFVLLAIAVTVAVGVCQAFAGQKIRLAQSSTVTNCMMFCNSTAANCQAGCLVPGTAPTTAATTTSNATASSTCLMACTTTQTTCQTNCARQSPSQ